MIDDSKIGIVTVLYNEKHVLQGFMESLAAQTFKRFILYVIDNSENNEAIDETKRLSSLLNIETIFTKNNTNLGVAKGNNQGIMQAIDQKCSHVLLINNDTEFEDRLVEKLLWGMDENSCEMIVPKMYYYGKGKKIWCAGGDFNKLYGFHTRHYGENEIDNGQYSTSKQIDYAPTCCMLINKCVFDEIGYMDEKYFVYSDDADFCYRSLEKKIKLFYFANATLYHKVSSSTGGSQSNFSIYYANRNLIYFSKKHCNLYLFIYILIFYQIKYFIKLFPLRRFTFKQFKLVQKAYFSGLNL